MDGTEQELQQASEHVTYEIRMLVATMSFLSKPDGETDWVASSAYLESFVLHLRNLIDFFYTPRRSRDLILAEHYVSDVAQWTADRGPITPLLSREKRRANKLIAHLSFGRLITDKTWDWGVIRAELQRVINCFLNHLPGIRKAWFGGVDLEVPAGPTGTSSLPVTRGCTGPPGPPVPEQSTIPK